MNLRLRWADDSHRFHAALAFLSAALAFSAATACAQQTVVEVSFNRDVRPILASHCVACHGGVMQAGDLSFVYRDKVLPPDGWVVEPGDPDESILLDRVVESDPELRMPPPDHGEALSDDEVATLRAWIQQGAKWERHWAYTQPRSPERPDIIDQHWPRQSVDYFVLARLESEGITPAPEESPSRWLRRAALDLVGVPPTPAERERFLTELGETGDAAYEAFVDRKLAEPGYGERWASVWLDQVRYADSRGLGLDSRRSVWKYRDWVIDALNDDLPYDQFTIKQIAGDLLPDGRIEDRLATAAHRLTQTNEEGGTDDEEFRVAAVLDRVNTVWQVWQGVTFSCVQCHSHPYEPIEHEEYYRFAAFFNNTQDCDLGEEFPLLQTPIDPDDYERAERLDAQIDRLRASVAQRETDLLFREEVWRDLRGLSVDATRNTEVRVEPGLDREEFRTVGTVASDTDIVVTAPIPEGIGLLTAIRLTGSPSDPAKAARDSEWGFVWSHVKLELVDPKEDAATPLSVARVIGDETAPFFDPAQSIDSKSKRGFAAYSRIHYPRSAAFVLQGPVPVTQDVRLRITLSHRYTALGAFPLVTKRGSVAISANLALTELLSDGDLTADRDRVKQVAAERAAIPSTTTPVLAERPERLQRPTHVFSRGLFLTKAAEVHPGTPAAFEPLPVGVTPSRLTLAHWLVSPRNPLTARVAVNRLWARLFGVGLVATEEDFGASGDRPSHPALLDDLATRFRGDMAWSQKRLIREIVLSATYRQSAARRPELLERDPDNRLLGCGPAIRMPAEMVRDQALAVSGLLSRKMHGPPMHPPIPDGVWRPFNAADKWVTAPPGDEDRYRRTVYAYVKRSIPYPMNAAFDAPSREVCTPRRLRSNTPLQALMTLNDRGINECAVALAERMRETAGDDPIARLRCGFERVLCRAPSGAELDVLTELHDTAMRDQRDGLYAVAMVLLNLDETLTK